MTLLSLLWDGWEDTGKENQTLLSMGLGRSKYDELNKLINKWGMIMDCFRSSEKSSDVCIKITQINFQ